MARQPHLSRSATASIPWWSRARTQGHEAAVNAAGSATHAQAHSPGTLPRHRIDSMDSRLRGKDGGEVRGVWLRARCGARRETNTSRPLACGCMRGAGPVESASPGDSGCGVSAQAGTMQCPLMGLSALGALEPGRPNAASGDHLAGRGAAGPAVHDAATTRRGQRAAPGQRGEAEGASGDTDNREDDQGIPPARIKGVAAPTWMAGFLTGSGMMLPCWRGDSWGPVKPHGNRKHPDAPRPAGHPGVRPPCRHDPS